MTGQTIPARLFANARARPDAPAYHVRGPDGWRATSWSTYAGQIRQAGCALVSLGLSPQDKVCLLGFNRPEWTITHLATLACGGVPAGIYETCSPEEIAYIIAHAQARIVLVEDRSAWEALTSVRDRLEQLQWIILMQGEHGIDDPQTLSWDDFLARGADTDVGVVHKRVDALDPEACAVLCYTSGTTGPPKGVMLSHRNLTWCADLAAQLVDLGAEDSSLSYLPLSHMAEQLFSVHVPATLGSSTYFATSREALLDNLKEVQPTVFFGVPRVWEKFSAGIQARLETAPAARRRLATWAASIGRRVSALRNQGLAPEGVLALQYEIARRVVFARLKRALGLARVRLCACGAAPASKDVLEFFASFDLPILEGYGQSETTSPVTFNLPGATRFGSVGRALPGVEIAIAPDDEILIRGQCVFLGYFGDPEATAATLVEGWVHTGDLGALDEDGYLRITGRKKEIIVTSGGKNIAPRNLEDALKALPLVSQAVVIGDRRKFLAALITLDPEAVNALGLESQAPHCDVRVIEHVQEGIDAQVNPRFARVEHIRRFTILAEEFSVDRGELTPTLKLKRDAIQRHFSAEIDAMYGDQDG